QGLWVRVGCRGSQFGDCVLRPSKDFAGCHCCGRTLTCGNEGEEGADQSGRGQPYAKTLREFKPLCGMPPVFAVWLSSGVCLMQNALWKMQSVSHGEVWSLELFLSLYIDAESSHRRPPPPPPRAPPPPPPPRLAEPRELAARALPPPPPLLNALPPDE